MKTNELSINEPVLAEVVERPLRVLLAGQGNEIVPVLAFTAGSRLQKITIRKSRAFAVRIRFSR
jgi:hypothetical protein